MKKKVLGIISCVIVILVIFGIKKVLPVLESAEVIKYDKNGNEIYIKYANMDNEIYQKYNDKNQLLESKNVFENGSKKEILYTYYEYVDDRLVKRIHKGDNLFEDENYEVTFEYNDQGLKIKETDSRKGITVYKYDENSNLISEILPDNKIINYDYDENGNLLKKEGSDGSIKEFEYDEKGRRLKETVKNDIFEGNRILRWEYFDDDPKISHIFYNEGENATIYMIYDKNNEYIETGWCYPDGVYKTKYKKIVLNTHWKNGKIKSKRVYTLNKTESFEKK